MGVHWLSSLVDWRRTRVKDGGRGGIIGPRQKCHLFARTKKKMAITHARTQANIINMMSMSRIQQVKTEKKKLQRGLLFMSVWERQRKMMDKESEHILRN